MINVLSSSDISATGMAAERLRMEVIANNIANANTTRGVDGQPYRRKQVVFTDALDAVGAGSGDGLGGVRVVGVEEDPTEFPMVYQPGHPDADAKGYVRLPNVRVATEMVDLITANRGYEANLRVMRTYRDMAQQALTLLRNS